MATYIRTVDGRLVVEIEPESPETMLPNISDKGLQAQIDTLRTEIRTYRGQPVVVTDSTDMEDELTIYLYMGSEEGYNADHWYYYDGTEWVDGGEYVANPVLIDDTLTQSGEAADAKVTGDEITAIKAELTYSNGRMRFLYSPIYGKNIIDSSEAVNEKYINWTNGNEVPNASYVASGYIPVIKGVLYGYTGSNTHFAFYDGSKKYIKETMANDITELDGGSVTVTAGSVPGQYFVSPIDGYVRYSMSSYYLPVAKRIFMAITSPADLIGTTYPAYTDTAYAEPIDRARLSEDEQDIGTLENEVENLYQIAQNGKKNSFEYTFNLAAGGYYNTDKSLEDECGYRISFTAKLSSLTGEIKINKGTDSGYGAGFGIDANNIYIYLGTNTTPARTQPHGLSFADYIGITIDSHYLPSVTVVISTNGGSYTWEGPYWSSMIGVLQVVSTLDALSDCFLSYACEGVTTDTWVYGDSYLLNRDNTRWPYYLVYKGYRKFLLNGYGGRTSTIALQSLKTDLALNRVPKRIVWTLGMNDKDGESYPNTNWMNVINELISICEAYNIELILSTVPNVPATTTKNTLKNAWVRNSGYRYIDFANAISANGDSTWYSGMLYTDNVHPTAQGAIALYHCAVTAVPELLL